MTAKITFKNLEFERRRDEKGLLGSFVRVHFLRFFYFDLLDEELLKIGKYKIGKNSIAFESPDKKAEKKFNMLLAKGFENLRSRITGKRTVYIHANSGIPLIGNNAFGIVDRNSSLIEIKPVTGCNIDCIYCSVDQDRRKIDYVVEEEYLVEELKKVIEFKGVDVQIFIGTQGEPMVYEDNVKLINDLSKIKKVKRIILSTNGTLLTKEIINKYAKAGLDQINISINAMDEELAKKICGPGYNLKQVLEMTEYAAKKIDVMITPVWIPGINDSELEPLLKFALKIKAGKKCPPLGIQNFLEYKLGRNPVKEQPWEKFYAKIDELEKKFKINLLKNSVEDFGIVETKKLPKPFDKDDVIKARIMCDGRLPGEKIAAAKGRNISVMNCMSDTKGEVKVKITRSKHNVFVGNLV